MDEQAAPARQTLSSCPESPAVCKAEDRVNAQYPSCGKAGIEMVELDELDRLAALTGLGKLINQLIVIGSNFMKVLRGSCKCVPL